MPDAIARAIIWSQMIVPGGRRGSEILPATIQRRGLRTATEQG